NRLLLLTLLLLNLAPTAAAQDPPLAEGLKNPVAATVGLGGKVYVAVSGPGSGNGSVLLIEKNKATPYATGLDAPQGLAAYQNLLFVVQRQRIVRIGPDGKADVFAPATAFPSEPQSLIALVVDPEN